MSCQSRPHIVVAGGGYAGRMALGRLRMACPEARITLVEPRRHSVERIHLHQVAADGVARHVPLAPLCARFGVDHVRQRLTSLDGRTVLLDDGSRIDADGILLALGSRTRPAPGPAFVLDDVASAQALHATLEQQPDAHVTVIGAGHTGLEAVTALAHRYRRAEVTLWRSTPEWPGSAAAAQAIERRLDALGVTVLDGGPVIGLDRTSAWSAHHRRPHDVAVWCAGFLPVTAGIPGPRTADGRLALGPDLQLTEGVFVAGDAGAPPRTHRLGCVTALPMGAHAARNLSHWLAGEPLAPFRFRDVVACLALDPGFGVVQPLDAGGDPLPRVLAGRPAGWVKAAILTYVRAMLSAEHAIRTPVFRWPQGRASARRLEESA